jgi:CheY-like chemotaxis protein/HPt (histidine-containing phosphotransfer) domain-containing protein
MKDKSFLESKGVNVNKALELFGDMETYNDTLKTFLAEIEKKLQDLSNFKATGDMANYAIQVHSLKSDARYFGFEDLGEMAYQHEMESKANNIYYITEHFDELMALARTKVNIAKEYMGEAVTSNDTMGVMELNTPKDKSILVVDDSPIIVNFVSKIFSNNYNVLTASDGNDAIEKLRTNGNIACMLLDLNMPNVDGFEVLDFIKENNYFVKLPVVVISGVENLDTIARAKSYPIVEVLEKPFNERDAEMAVNRCLATYF